MAAPRRRVRQRPDEEEEDVVVRDSQEPDSQTTPQKKRRVGESDDEGHVEGAIVRVHLQNFITYDDCSFEPGPRLNVVIGPNGSGKSSIVCALALGLAGSTSLLGRAKDVSEYIKYGAEKASITIELKGAQNSRNVVIRRDIKKDNSSEWRLNGKVVTKNDVIAKTKSMNVQVDNLCQFLPQDKVGSFAAMDPAQLLIETEKAVGTDKMYEYHEELINLRKTEKELDRTCEEHGNIAQDLKKKNESLERDVLRFQERQKLVQKVEILEKKKPWLLFEDQRRIALELKDQRAEVNANYNEALQQKEPLEKKKKEIETKSKSIESTRLAANNNLRKHSQEKDARKKELEELERQADGLEVDFENLKNRAKNREKEAQAMKREITSSREEMKTLPTALEVKAIIDEKNGELKELNRGLGQIQAKKMTTQDSFKTSQSELNKFQAKVKEADDARHQAIENMRRLNPDVYTAYVWVQQNQSKFKDKVYGPVCLEINVPDPLYAKYLEMTIPNWLITCFVCQNAEDRDLLLAELADKQKLPVNATFLPGAVNRERRADLAPLKRCGIDVFTTSAPVVKEVLIANASVDIVAVGNSESVHHVEELLQSDLGLFYTPESRYAKTRSKYENRSISTSVVALKNAKYLSGVNMEQVREARRKMEEKRMELEVIREALTTCDQEEQQINVTINNIRKERDNANNDKKKADTIQKKIELKEKQLASLLKEEDTAQEEEALRNKLRGINVNRARQAVALKSAIMSLVEAQISVDVTSLTRLDVQAALTKITDEIKVMDATHANLKRELEEISKRFDRAREYARKLKDEAERKAPLDGELTATLAELPNTIDELDAMITEHNKKIELLYATNPAVVQQYEARKREIEDISEKLESEQAQLAELKKKIADVKGKWLPPLEALMSKINITFSKFFSEIGCVGEVALEKHEDYDKYGVQIKVKFRFEDSLQALNSHLQSGGERSVSTMLYLISLQDLTPCPFRVVDEINQGMDPYNERMIFRQVVQSAGRPGLPQYFLITPKLLPDLDYTPNMTVLCVYNGPWQFTQDEWDKRVKRIFS